MATSPNNIHPEFARMLGREAKEARWRQRGGVVWLYGLSGSGKSTLANAVERQLFEEGRLTQILDGDNIRTGLNRDLGFSDEERRENIRRIAEVARLFCHAGFLTLTSFITPTHALRAQAREVIGEADFLEVYVKASFETCAERDVKGLYAKAASGQLKQFTGKDSGFEEPPADAPALVVDTEQLDLEASVARVRQAVETRFPLPVS